MSKPKIVRVWGKADSLDIEFTKKGERWYCTVPPDTKDGQYAVEIHAINEFGETAYWTGVLYMCNGVCCLRIFDSPYTVWIKSQSLNIDFKPQKYEVCFITRDSCIKFMQQNYSILICKGCENARKY